jgi:FixJ family two-component response regulator
MRQIAVVDDDAAVREFVCATLNQGGYATKEFENGRDYLVGHGTATRGVILGIVMPVMDGFETMREMKRLNMNVPVVAMSGSQNMTACDLVKYGAKAFIAKPFRVDQLLDAARRFIF